MVLLLELPTFRIDVLVSHVCSVVVQDYQTKKTNWPEIVTKTKTTLYQNNCMISKV